MTSLLPSPFERPAVTAAAPSALLQGGACRSVSVGQSRSFQLWRLGQSPAHSTILSTVTAQWMAHSLWPECRSHCSSRTTTDIDAISSTVNSIGAHLAPLQARTLAGSPRSHQQSMRPREITLQTNREVVAAVDLPISQCYVSSSVDGGST